MMDINKELSDTSSALYVLSTLMRKPQILEEDYTLLPDDFTSPLQRITFTSIYNMEKNGAEHLTPQDIDLYIKTQPQVYDYYLQNKGYEWLQTTYNLTENGDSNQFKYYYTRLKKFSILRELVRAGIDISDFYDISKDLLSRDEEDEKLDQISGDEIINHIREKLVGIEDKNVGKRASSYQTVDAGVDDFVEEHVLVLPPHGSVELQAEVPTDDVHAVPLVVGPYRAGDDAVHVQSVQGVMEALHVGILLAGGMPHHELLAHGLREKGHAVQVGGVENPRGLVLGDDVDYVGDLVSALLRGVQGESGILAS